MIEVLHDVFIGTVYLFGAAALLALALFMTAVIRELVRYMRRQK